MILVIIGHTNYQQPILTLIYSFHMPLFFIVSGILFDEHRYKSFLLFIKRKIHSLLLPFVIYFGLALVLALYENFSNGFEFTQLLSVLKSMIFARNSSDFHYNPPLWFVPTLFLVECIYYFVNKIKNKDWYIITIIVLLLLGWYFTLLSKIWNIFVWNIPTCFVSIGFYAIGHRILRPFYTKRRDLVLNRKKYFLISLFSFALMVPIALANGKISLGSNIVNCVPFLYLSGVLGTVSVLSLSQVVSSGFVEFIGRNSFDFLGVHGLVRYIFIYLMLKMISVDFWCVCEDYLYTIPMFVAVFSVSYFVVIINQYVKKGEIVNAKD